MKDLRKLAHGLEWKYEGPGAAEWRQLFNCYDTVLVVPRPGRKRWTRTRVQRAARRKDRRLRLTKGRARRAPFSMRRA